MLYPENWLQTGMCFNGLHPQPANKYKSFFNTCNTFCKKVSFTKFSFISQLPTVPTCANMALEYKCLFYILQNRLVLMMKKESSVRLGVFVIVANSRYLLDLHVDQQAPPPTGLCHPPEASHREMWMRKR